eukprot:Skav210957  [mRNA]  locus=scaffold713:352783:353052:- [translate_table: standard]
MRKVDFYSPVARSANFSGSEPLLDSFLEILQAHRKSHRAGLIQHHPVESEGGTGPTIKHALVGWELARYSELSFWAANQLDDSCAIASH